MKRERDCGPTDTVPVCVPLLRRGLFGSFIFSGKEQRKKQLPAEKIHEWAYPLRERSFTPKIELTAFDRQAEAVSAHIAGEYANLIPERMTFI